VLKENIFHEDTYKLHFSQALLSIEQKEKEKIAEEKSDKLSHILNFRTSGVEMNLLDHVVRLSVDGLAVEMESYDNGYSAISVKLKEVKGHSDVLQLVALSDKLSQLTTSLSEAKAQDPLPAVSTDSKLKVQIDKLEFKLKLDDQMPFTNYEQIPQKDSWHLILKTGDFTIDS